MQATTSTVGTPRRYKDGWLVPSSTGMMEYHVRREGGRWICQCPSHRWRQQTLCRHVQAVIRAEREVPMGK
jgi:hypothetical protein